MDQEKRRQHINNSKTAVREISNLLDLDWKSPLSEENVRMLIQSLLAQVGILHMATIALLQEGEEDDSQVH